MTTAEIGGRRVHITKDGDKITVVFHPIAKNAKIPNAKVFTLKLSKKDIETLKSSF